MRSHNIDSVYSLIMCIQTRAWSRLSSHQPPGVVDVAAGLGANLVAFEADREEGLGAVAEVAVDGAVVACSVAAGSVIDVAAGAAVAAVECLGAGA